MSQKSLALLLGEPQSYVSKYELGERRIDLVEAYEICRALHVDFVVFVKQFVRTVESKDDTRAVSPHDRRNKR